MRACMVDVTRHTYFVRHLTRALEEIPREMGFLPGRWRCWAGSSRVRHWRSQQLRLQGGGELPSAHTGCIAWKAS